MKSSISQLIRTVIFTKSSNQQRQRQESKLRLPMTHNPSGEEELGRALQPYPTVGPQDPRTRTISTRSRFWLASQAEARSTSYAYVSTLEPTKLETRDTRLIRVEIHNRVSVSAPAITLLCFGQKVASIRADWNHFAWIRHRFAFALICIDSRRYVSIRDE